jgi:hypothetical protein
MLQIMTGRINNNNVEWSLRDCTCMLELVM